MAIQKITPFLWFNDKAEEAMKFYISIFKNSKTLNFSRISGVGNIKIGTLPKIADAKKSKRVMDSILQMDKIEIEVLKRVYEQKGW